MIRKETQNHDSLSSKSLDDVSQDLSSAQDNSELETHLPPSELLTIVREGSESPDEFNKSKQTPQTLGHYEIVGELGSGGMGVVFKAYDPALKRYATRFWLCRDRERTVGRSVAYVDRQQADWEIQQKRSAQGSIAKGFEWIEKSLKMGGENPDAVALQGALFLLQARTDRNPEERARYATSAATALDKAIKMNPLLRQQYEPLLKEVKTLSVH